MKNIEKKAYVRPESLCVTVNAQYGLLAGSKTIGENSDGSVRLDDKETDSPRSNHYGSRWDDEEDEDY